MRQNSKKVSVPKFKILSIFLSEAYIKIHPENLQQNAEYEIETGFNVNYSVNPENKKQVQVVVSVVSNNAKQPFTFKVDMVGNFEFNRILKKEEMDRITNINCAAIIFPFVRETIAELTRKAVTVPFIMGPINFVEIYNKKLSDKQKEKETKKKNVKSKK